ncbi:hypothetical protein OXV40_33045, partial [Burkholderia contaminans]|uniref:solute carrier family 23 protein n=1 Tax=Burkholderia contaminans TaxID=488447 RepID=UPI002D7FCD1B
AGIAAQSGLPTAAGSALLASAFYWVLLPVFTRCLRLFPRIVVGAMLLLVSVNLIRIYATIVVGQPGSADFAQPRALGLALATIVATVVVAGAFRGTLGRLAVLIGLMAGATLGWALGAMPALADVWRGPLFTHPVWLPFGMPRFDVLAALPLLIFTAISMAEATAQTVAVGETCGKAISLSRDVPKTIRGDALASLAGALMPTSTNMIIYAFAAQGITGMLHGQPVSGVSIGDLLFSGLLPVLWVMGFVLAAAYWQAVRHGYPRREDGSSALPAFPGWYAVLRSFVG